MLCPNHPGAKDNSQWCRHIREFKMAAAWHMIFPLLLYEKSHRYHWQHPESPICSPECRWLLTGTRREGHISPMLRQLHWLPVKRRVDFKLACFVFSSLFGQTPSYLADDIWSRKGLDAVSARLPTDRVLFHAHTTHSVTGVLLLPGHVSGTASQQTYHEDITYT